MLVRPLPDAHTFTSAAEMRAHYADVRKRIYGEPKKQEFKCVEVMNRSIPVEVILSEVAAFYCVSLADILVGKTSALVTIRYVSMYLACRVGKKPLRHVCKVMNFHVNTVYDGISKIQERLSHDAMLNSQLKALTSRIDQLLRK
jgi:chromosomal replication initiation ATPase DnaA